MKVRTSFAILLLTCAVSAPLVGAVNNNNPVRAAEPPVIKEAPPAPVIKDEERVAELRGRRERVAAKLGPSALLVLFMNLG